MKLIRRDKVSVLDLGRNARLDLVKSFLLFCKYINKSRPAIIYSFLPVPNLFLIPVKVLFPKLVIIWGVRASGIDYKNYPLLVKFIYKIQFLLSFIPNAIVVNSFCGRNILLENGVRKKIYVIHNGIDTSCFTFSKKKRIQYRKKLLVKNQILITIVGRADPMKGHEIFIKAAAEYLSIRNDVFFLFVGSRETKFYREYLLNITELRKLEGCSKWVEDEEDMVAVYSATDILTSSSYYGEGFSNVLAEGMSCGTICIGTNVGDSKCIVNQDFLIDPYKYDELKNAWNKAINLLKSPEINDFRKRARNDVLRKFSISSMTDKTIKVFKEISN